MAAFLEHLLHAYGYAAIVAATHQLNPVGIVIAGAVAAFGGSVAGFAIGRRGERRFVHRFGRYLHLDERDLRLGRYLFRRFGGRVVFLARFVAFLRSVAGLLAGANGMSWRRFVISSGLGALAWSATFGFAAYALGQRVELLSVRADVVFG